jgi:hypothetical protein
MALLGNGLLAVWNDIPPDVETRFNSWYRDEHMAERVALPGFRRGRRYHALNGAPAYGALYECDTPEAMASEAYSAQLDDPTPLTSEMLAQFSNMHRTVCRVEASRGRGMGGALAVLRPGDEAAATRFAGGISSLLECSGIVAAHLCVGVPALTHNDSVETRVRVGADKLDVWLALIEGNDATSLRAALGSAPAALYELIHVIHIDDL